MKEKVERDRPMAEKGISLDEIKNEKVDLVSFSYRFCFCNVLYILRNTLF